MSPFLLAPLLPEVELIFLCLPICNRSSYRPTHGYLPPFPSGPLDIFASELCRSVFAYAESFHKLPINCFVTFLYTSVMWVSLQPFPSLARFAAFHEIRFSITALLTNNDIQPSNQLPPISSEREGHGKVRRLKSVPMG